MANALNVIYPYRHAGRWVFDDEKAGLDKEPFVAGADLVIGQVVSLKGIKDAENGFRLIFSAGPFPNYDYKFDWVREGDGGNWYRVADLRMEAWLCPALFKYFNGAPMEIYARFEPKNRKAGRESGDPQRLA